MTTTIMIRPAVTVLMIFMIVSLTSARPMIQVEDFFVLKRTENAKKTAKKAVDPPPVTDFFVPKGMPKLARMAEGHSDGWDDAYSDLSLSLSLSMTTSHPIVPTVGPPVKSPAGHPTISPPTYTHPHQPVSRPVYTPTALPPVMMPTHTSPTYTPPRQPVSQPIHTPTMLSPVASPTHTPPVLPPVAVPTERPGYPTAVSPTHTPGYPTSTYPGPTFTCTQAGVGVTEAPNDTTTVSFRVGYLVESMDPPSDYLASVEGLIVEMAIVGTLQCATGNFGFASGVEPSLVVVTSTQTDQCTPTQSGAACTVWQTSFVVTVAGKVDPTVASFLGYMFVQEEMSKKAILGDIAALQRIEYMSPSPLLPPITGINGNPSQAPGSGTTSAAGELSVNRWTLGAVLTMCVGGVVALAVWIRNRRTRNERHLQLMEDVSIATPVAHGRSEV